jgi:CDP-2,3-bis-(O-geranylgeranyl)-sn-glycerol synthase
MLLWTVASSIWFFLPAMLPNTAAAILGGGVPIDFGRKMGEQRVLGDGKTWRGLLSGVLSGIFLGYLEALIAYSFIPELRNVYHLSPVSLLPLIALSAGSMSGDICGAFVKRRFGLERGAPVPILDQYDFAAGAMLFAYLISPAYALKFLFMGNAIIGLVIVLVIIYPLHRLVNYIGYRRGLKNVPW